MREPRDPASKVVIAATAACVAAATACGSGGAGGAVGAVETGGRGLSWDGFRLGMRLEQAEGRAGERLDLREVEDLCGDVGARTVRSGRELFLGFTGDSASAVLHTLVVRLPGERSREEVVRELKRRIPDLRYRPGRHWPDMPEEENPKPLYVTPRHPDQGILVGVEEGWMWLSFLDCMD